jgi:hypothetical protein
MIPGSTEERSWNSGQFFDCDPVWTPHLTADLQPEVDDYLGEPDINIRDTRTGKLVATVQQQPRKSRGLFEIRESTMMTGEGLGLMALNVVIQENLRSSPIVSSDGRWLCNVDTHARIHLWEIVTGKKRCVLGGGEALSSIVFDRSSQWLVTGSTTGSVMIWDLYQIPDASAVDDEEEPPALDGHWQALHSADAAQAFRTIKWLIAHPLEATALFRDKLKMTPVLDAQKIKTWIAELDNDRFEARQYAARMLTQYRERAEGALREAAESPKLEVRTQARLILARRDVLTPDRLARLRAIEVLERIASAEAHRLLKRFSEDADVRAASDARDALARFGKLP